MDYRVVFVAALQHEQQGFCQTTQRLLQILSEQQFLIAGTFEDFFIARKCLTAIKPKSYRILSR